MYNLERIRTVKEISDYTIHQDQQMSNESLELSIVMPCLNEAETLAICIKKAQSYLERSGVAGEIVIGDNGSTDGSQEIATNLGARVIDIPIRGYGAALYGAVTAARGRYCYERRCKTRPCSAA